MKKIKLQYKILFIIFLFFTLFWLNNKSYATSYDLSSVITSDDHYAIYKATDNNIYLVKNTTSDTFNRFHLSYYTANNHIISSRGNTVGRLGDVALYLLNNGSCSYIGTFGYGAFEGTHKDLYNVSEMLYSYRDIKHVDTDNIFYSANPITDFTNVNIGDTVSTVPELEYIEFVSDGELLLRTNYFDFSYVSSYDLYLSFNDTNNFVKVGNKATITDTQSNKTFFYFTYKPEFGNGIYYFRVYNKATDEWSNTYTFNITGVDFGSTVDASVEIPDFYIKKENNYFVLQTQWLDLEKRDYYDLYYSKANDFFINCEGDNLSTLTLTDNGVTYFRYQFIVNQESTYYFKFLNTEDPNNILSSEVVEVHLSLNEDYNNTIIAIPSYETVPALDYTLSFEEFDKIILYSQWFDISKANFYKLYLYDNISNWNDTNSEIEYKDNLFRFKYTITENRVYHFRIYNIVGDTAFYSSTVSLTVTYIGTQTYFDYMKNKLIDLCRNSLGFLYYPFDLIFTILNKFLNIEFENPQINIPDIYLPFSGENYKLIDNFTFNFTDYINQNNIFKTIHNLILIGSDFIIIWGVVHLLRKEWEAFFK